MRTTTLASFLLLLVLLSERENRPSTAISLIGLCDATELQRRESGKEKKVLSYRIKRMLKFLFFFERPQT